MQLGNKIMLIAPYKDLAEMAENINKTNKINVIIRTGNLPGCLDLLEEAHRRDVEVIVTRGGVATTLKNIQSKIPIVEIPVTGFEVLEAIKSAMRYGRSIGVVGFSNVVKGANRIANIFDIPLYTEIRTAESDCEILLTKLRKKAVSVIVGDTVSVKKASALGMNHVLIKTGEEGLIAAYEEADRLIEHLKRERIYKSETEAILECSLEAIVSTNATGAIKYINERARRMLVEQHGCYDSDIRTLLNEIDFDTCLINGQPVTGQVGKLGNKKIVISQIPIIDNNDISGMVVTFQEIGRYEEVHRKVRSELARKGLVAKATFNAILGISQTLRETKRLAKSYSNADCNILIEGRTGTGKEIFAQAIHNEGSRAKGPFVAINCAALPTDLLESELFGYIGGAFTGARKDGKKGLFEMADEGTLLLDEINELPVELQAKLLRAIQENEIRRIGDDRIIPINVRLICTTNKNLSELIEQGRFREDLYYRINILTLKIPTLQERRADIPFMAKYFLGQYCNKYHKPVKKFSRAALKLMEEYHWPGNIRQLRSMIERITVSTPGSMIEEADLEELKNTKSALLSINEITRETIVEALKQAQGNHNMACVLLGISRTTLWRKKRKYNL